MPKRATEIALSEKEQEGLLQINKRHGIIGLMVGNVIIHVRSNG